MLLWLFREQGIEIHSSCLELEGFPIPPLQGLGPNQGRCWRLKPLLGKVPPLCGQVVFLLSLSFFGLFLQSFLSLTQTLCFLRVSALLGF